MQYLILGYGLFFCVLIKKLVLVGSKTHAHAQGVFRIIFSYGSVFTQRRKCLSKDISLWSNKNRENIELDRGKKVIFYNTQ